MARKDDELKKKTNEELIKIIEEQNKKLKVTKPGSQTRNFTHIDDTINALLLIADKGYGDQYGIANPREYTVKQVAEMISDQIEFISENVANRMKSEIISKKLLDLGWKPNIELSDYIKNQL